MVCNDHPKGGSPLPFVGDIIRLKSQTTINVRPFWIWDDCQGLTGGFRSAELTRYFDRKGAR
jgi:hypothetical protein